MALRPPPGPSRHLFPVSYHAVDRRRIKHCQKVTIKKRRRLFPFYGTLCSCTAIQIFALLLIIHYNPFFTIPSLQLCIPIAQVEGLIWIMAAELPAGDKPCQKTFGDVSFSQKVMRPRAGVGPLATEKCNVCTEMENISFLLVSAPVRQGYSAAQVKQLDVKAVVKSWATFFLCGNKGVLLLISVQPGFSRKGKDALVLGHFVQWECKWL